MATSRLLHFLRQLRARHSCTVHDRVVREDHLRCVVVDETLDAEDAWPNDHNVRLHGSDFASESEDGEISHDDHYRFRRLLDAVHRCDVDRYLLQQSSENTIVARRCAAKHLSAAEWRQSSDLHDVQPSKEIIV